jgi:hypothetical protein
VTFWLGERRRAPTENHYRYRSFQGCRAVVALVGYERRAMQQPTKGGEADTFVAKRAARMRGPRADAIEHHPSGVQRGPTDH